MCFCRNVNLSDIYYYKDKIRDMYSLKILMYLY